MDIITRHYIRKAKLDVSDEYHERLALEDMNELTKASVYMMLAPTFTFAILFGYHSFRTQGGGQSAHFQYAIDRAKSRFKSGDTTSWPSKKSMPEGKIDFDKSESG